MNESFDSERLNCAVADSLHKFTSLKNYNEEGELKKVIDLLNERAPDRPCLARTCPSAEVCLKFAGLALELRSINHPQPNVNVTIQMPQDSKGV
jgi:hypothetical protein